MKLQTIAIPVIAAFLTCTAQSAPVKQSRSHICHDESSEWYQKVKHYQSFDSMAECLKTGRLPKGSTYQKLTSSVISPLDDVAPTSYMKYDRSLYQHWVDEDGDGLDTRHEMLVASNIGLSSINGKYVVKGRWRCPYTGREFTSPHEVEIDHRVPLYYAHRAGAWRFSPLKKKAFANDMSNLAVVSAQENQDKKAKGLSDYLPAIGRCDYAQKFDATMKKYGLQYVGLDKQVAPMFLQQCQENEHAS